MKDPSRQLEELTREARAEATPPVDWERVEAKLMDRVRAHAAAEDAAEKRAGGGWVWAPVAVGLAAAAAAALLIGSGGRGGSFDAPTATADRAAGTLSGGEALVNGAAASTGSPLAVGESIETRDARAWLTWGGARPNGAGAVKWTIEPRSKVTIERSGATLVVQLDRGALEAQVTPVPDGEAFAVDVRGAASASPTRVAVHGTHLRVERRGDEAVVDLTEGVVTIGAPPRVGTTYGALVTAPAHAEFAALDPTGTLRVDHARDSVRAAVPFEAAAEPPVALAPAPTAAPAPVPATAPHAPATTSAPLAMSAPPKPEPSTTTQPPAAPAPSPNAEADLAQAIRACLAAQPTAPDVVLTSVSTRLDLRVGDDGMVKFARFDPPLAPDAHACATAAIYKTRFAHAGAVTIPIEYQK